MTFSSLGVVRGVQVSDAPGGRPRRPAVDRFGSGLRCAPACAPRDAAGHAAYCAGWRRPNEWGRPGGSRLVLEWAVVGVEDSPAKQSQDVVPDRRWQVAGVVAAVGLGADPLG